MRGARRTLAVAIVATVALAGLASDPAHAGGSQAVVIVDTGAGTYTRVISFSGSISGFDALVLAGANPQVAASDVPGKAICQLFGVGNPTSSDDVCLGRDNGDRYWAYYRAPGGSGGWQYSSLGASATRVSDGDVEGWRFGGGAPRFQSFCDVVGCAPPPAPAPPEPGPPPPAPGGTGAGGEVASVGGAAAAPAGNAGEPTSEPTVPSDTAPPSETTPSTTREPTEPTEPAQSAQQSRRERRALDAGPVVVADDDDAGSPAGVIVAVALVAGIGALAFVVRRRRRSTG